jgi:hypothetical protein
MVRIAKEHTMIFAIISLNSKVIKRIITPLLALIVILPTPRKPTATDFIVGTVGRYSIKRKNRNDDNGKSNELSAHPRRSGRQGIFK